MPIDPRSFARDESGAVAVIVSLLLTVLLGFVALGVDVASLYRERAVLQSTADLTAMSSVADTANAGTRAAATLARNNRPGVTLTELQTGRFLRNPDIPPAQRFIPLAEGSPGMNAVAVRLAKDAPLHFAQVLSDADHVALSRRAMAIRTGAASFSLDSSIARLDPAGFLNALNASFGTEVSISAGDLDLMAQTEINAGDLLDALRTLTGDTARNPAAILDAEVTAAQVLSAVSTVAPGLAAPLSDLIAAGGAMTVPVAAIVGGIDSELGYTATEFAAEIELSARDILSALIDTRGRTQAIALDTALNVPGVASASAQLTVNEPPVHSGWIALGEEGVQLRRSAMRLRSDVSLAPELLTGLGAGVSVTQLNIPLYTELAGAAATLEEISCTGTALSDEVARFSTAPTPLHPGNGSSVAALYLGTLSDGGGQIDPATLNYADILDLKLRIELPLLPDVVIEGITLQARSHVALGQSQTETLRFTRAEAQAGQPVKYFGSGDLLATGINSLLSPEHLDLRVKPGQETLVSGVAAPLLNTVLDVLPGQILANLASPVDAVTDAILQEAGLRLGEGALTLTGHHCELVKLVQ